MAIDSNWNERIVAADLNMPIDVTVGAAGTVWVLEFARFDPEGSCFTGDGYQPGTGMLSRLDGDRLTTVIDQLDSLGAVVAGPDVSLYVSDVFAGRILRIGASLVGADERAAADTEPAARPWRLNDVTAEVGLDVQHGAFTIAISEDPVAMMGGGLCWLDTDGDDDVDLYVTAEGPNALLINDGSGRFTERAGARGLAVDGWS